MQGTLEAGPRCHQGAASLGHAASDVQPAKPSLNLYNLSKNLQQTCMHATSLLWQVVISQLEMK